MQIMPEGLKAGLLVVVDIEDEAVDGLAALQSHLATALGDGNDICVLFLPRSEAAQTAVFDSFNTHNLALATHGTELRWGQIITVPHGRHFVLEEGRLCLKPAIDADPSKRLARLLASLGPLSERSLLLSDAEEPTGAAAPEPFLSRGGRLLPLAGLSGGLPLFVRPADDSMPRTPPTSNMLAHEMRQPLQTLVLLQSLLKKQLQEPRHLALLDRMGETLAHLNQLLSTPPAAGNRALIPLLVESSQPEPFSPEGERLLVYIIDDDTAIRAAMRDVLEAEGCEVRDFAACEQFLDAFAGEPQGCLLIDAYLPGMSGLDLLQEMGRRGHPIPSILMTGSSDVQMAVSAMKLGASDFLENPVTAPALLSGLKTALMRARNSDVDQSTREKALQALKGLTRRQRQIMTMVLDGHPSKNIAADLGISQRTVENHRAAIMRKTGSRSLPQLARLILALPASEIE